ncbi:MAG: rRNA (cytidine1920-2-O)/16S rRNA (cytidine1409-2-O)-methyltransferase [Frankiales bacterium]|jgi:23S rRNA (cytidine1920-2'-O)/16S rRNA (cytidine1409-2'-O)-methyltransferase|nr:rRNA (cytidine1920-2-O)/16S rRNA (cytidine1409-2-O)-methyltransferase [Frankiales bacterium]
MARSRDHAVELVDAGRVTVGGQRATKPATQVDGADALHVQPTAEGDDYVSRGAHKLIGALDAFAPAGLTVSGRRCLDAGASTGGFTDVLLRRGARQVVAVDVGYGQLAWRLRQDERVVVQERTNVRNLAPADIGGQVELVVADLSFISLRMVLPALAACSQHLPPGDLVLMVKPQFEVGREQLGAGGVVRDPGLRAASVRSVATAAAEHQLGVAGVTASPLPGPSGNVEYFLWLRRDAGPLDEAALETALREGPS